MARNVIFKYCYFEIISLILHELSEVGIKHCTLNFDIYLTGNKLYTGFPCSSVSKESACNTGDPGSILGLGRSPGVRNGNPWQTSILAWRIPWAEEPGVELDLATRPPPPPKPYTVSYKLQITILHKSGLSRKMGPIFQQPDYRRGSPINI